MHVFAEFEEVKSQNVAEISCWQERNELMDNWLEKVKPPAFGEASKPNWAQPHRIHSETINDLNCMGKVRC